MRPISYEKREKLLSTKIFNILNTPQATLDFQIKQHRRFIRCQSFVYLCWCDRFFQRWKSLCFWVFLNGVVADTKM